MPFTLPAAPGVYIEEDASLSLSINSSATAVPVFIGKFTRADGSNPTSSKCIRITSWLDFTSQFVSGEVSVTVTTAPPPSGSNSLADDYTYTFESTVNSHNAYFAVQHYFNNGGGVCYLLPLLANDAAELAALPMAIEKERNITLLVCPETDVTLGEGKKQEIYTALNDLLQNKIGYFLIADSEEGTDKPATEAAKTAVYYPDLITPFKSRPADANIAVTGYSDAVQSSVSTLAELQAINADLYQRVSADLDTKLADPIILPPSAAVAGAYCASDASRGVWKAPANVALSNVNGLTKAITDADQASLNAAGINAIRNFTGKGTLIWGARTLVPENTPDWLYIPVRRLFNSAERDIKQAMQFAVFEPNSQPTWERVRAAIEHYLYSLWQQGALSGTKASEAYFVQIGKGITMTDDDINQGKMIVKVGMAAVRPAEFIILQFTQNIGQ